LVGPVRLPDGSEPSALVGNGHSDSRDIGCGVDRLSAVEIAFGKVDRRLETLERVIPADSVTTCRLDHAVTLVPSRRRPTSRWPGGMRSSVLSDPTLATQSWAFTAIQSPPLSLFVATITKRLDLDLHFKSLKLVGRLAAQFCPGAFPVEPWTCDHIHHTVGANDAAKAYRWQGAVRIRQDCRKAESILTSEAR